MVLYDPSPMAAAAEYNNAVAMNRATVARKGDAA